MAGGGERRAYPPFECVPSKQLIFPIPPEARIVGLSLWSSIQERGVTVDRLFNPLPVNSIWQPRVCTHDVKRYASDQPISAGHGPPANRHV